MRAEVELVSNSELTLVEAHGIAEEAHHRLLHEVPRLAQATIHSNPCNHDGSDHHVVSRHHF